MNVFRPTMVALAPLAMALFAGVGHSAHANSSPQAAEESRTDSSPLVDEVRAATSRYRDINVARSEGFARATPCVSGPDTGAMGVHFVLQSRITAGVLQADEPEALIYEPLPSGALRLVGVEFIVLASVWQKLHPAGPAPALDGNLLNYVGEPNRYGLPAFYEIHVWAWENNPKGSFADWNTHVTCEKQPVN